MYFRCDTCRRIYRDYYPPDDSCIKCGKGLVRWFKIKPLKDFSYNRPLYILKLPTNVPRARMG